MTTDFWDEPVVWRMVSRSSLYHVDNGEGRAACMTGRTLDGPEAPEDFVPWGPPLIRQTDGAVRFVAKPPVCMRCQGWLDARGRWGPRE